MRIVVQIVLAAVVLALGVAGAKLVLENPREAEREEQPVVAPVVETVSVAREDHRLLVRTHGVARPVRDAELAVEVEGRVLELGPDFVVGGFVEQGDLLLRLDDSDRRQELAEARAAVAAAELRVATETHEAEVARQEWSSFGEGPPDPLLVREPQLAEARAALEAARAREERARRDVERTELRAPFAARVAERHAELGEWIGRGMHVARVIGTERAEIRLPVTDAELAALAPPLRASDWSEPVPVTLHGRFAGRRVSWPARVVRSEGEIDPRTRMLTLVAEIDDPYARRADAGDARPPLVAGLFVEAELAGRRLQDVFVVPRVALRDGHQLAVVQATDDGHRLRLRSVEPVYLGDETVVLDAGLEAGERLAVTQLEIMTDGMRVRLADETASVPSEAPPPGVGDDAAPVSAEDAAPAGGGAR